MKAKFLVSFILSSLVIAVTGYAGIGFDPLERLMRAKPSKDGAVELSVWEDIFELDRVATYSPVYVGPQGGLMEADKIDKLLGQPDGVDFDQYAGYVTVDPNAGRALFYYFTESPENAWTKPLVLWLNGGPGCSSFGNGAMMELGPFRVNSDNTTLSRNVYAWNKAANVIFLESPAGVGFSYSNKTSDYDLNGDTRTAQDSYTFLVNWLERFPQYKTRDFYITGESYAGHYVPQLAYTILQNNKITNQTVINLQGIAIGNAWIDEETGYKGKFEYFWTHALISDEIYDGITMNCNFSSVATTSPACEDFIVQTYVAMENIFINDIYAPLCKSSSSSTELPVGVFDPCSDVYIESYLNLPQVQMALHANVTSIPYPWTKCSSYQLSNWKERPSTVLPTIKRLMASGLRVWIYSGDTDGNVPVISTRYSIKSLDTFVKTSWYPWYTQGEVGGYAVGYENLTFVTVRGAGHFVPSYQPARALALFSSFLQGKLPPSS